jgi:very-short-patch-repair endonuclease
MTRIFNTAKLKERRRKLRNNQTFAEKHLWQHIRRKQICGIQFYRQYGIGSYIADFYAPAIKLCIEVDGKQHYTSTGREYDTIRDDFMKSLRISVLRFPNEEVLENTENVMKLVTGKVGEMMKENPSAVSLMPKGEH